MWTELDRLAEMPGWLARLDDDAVVREALLPLVPGLRDARLSGLRLKSDVWSAECALQLSDRDEPVRVHATVRPPGRRMEPVSTPERAPGDPDWAVTAPSLRLELASTDHADTDLPALALLTDPLRARSFLEEAVRQGAPAYRDLRILAVRPRVMRHSPGSRCTVLFQLELPDVPAALGWPDVMVAKTYHRTDKGETAWDGMRALWASPLATSAVAIAQPLAWRPDLRILVQGPVRGDRTLKDLLLSTLARPSGSASARLRDHLAAAATGLAELHRCGVTTGRTVTWESELAEVRQVAARLTQAVPELAGATDGLLSQVQQRAAAVPLDKPVPSHRSFRPAQVLLHGDQVGFIDFDGFCQAEPALDVALFRATVRDLGMSALPGDLPLADRLSVLDELCEHFLAGYEAHAPVSRERVALWEVLDLLTNVLHSWTKVKPARLARATAVLRHHLAGGDLVGTPRPSPDTARLTSLS